jgi:2,4-dienoyl-CoA reductase [(3E)-enoyl-CoA-producing], peroxisomal
MFSAFRSDVLRDRVALITGGGTGICRAVALAFARHGCAVAIASRKVEHLEPTLEELRAVGPGALAVTGDVRDPAAVERFIAETVGRFGRLDVLVNGAAGNFLCLAENLSPNGFGAVVDIDLKGTFHCCRASLPHLRASRGSILNISATLHFAGTIGQLHVSAAKAGIDALTRNLAVEWGRDGIRVNGIAPGPIDGTEGVKRLLTDRARRDVVESTPLGRLGSLDEIADAALFLTSEAARFVNGVTLVVDGGLCLGSVRTLGGGAEAT